MVTDEIIKDFKQKYNGLFAMSQKDYERLLHIISLLSFMQLVQIKKHKINRVDDLVELEIQHRLTKK